MGGYAVRAWSITGGVGLLLMAALAGFGNLTTSDSSDDLFRAGVASLFLVVVLDVVVACALYRVFEPIDRTVSFMAAAFRLVYATVFMVAIGQLLQASTDAFSDLWRAGLGLFGVHLILLGYLTARTTRWLAALLVIAGLGYLTDAFATFFAQDLTNSTYTFIGELLLAIWLLVRPRTRSWAGVARGEGVTGTAPIRR
ncbi:DUF4386 domain-containing protein [Kribbella sp. NPDC050470]|uniref:DUF4386 domain-containing protein n=1 Tax=unclassified Kribbella TaxID=2644121 RepID=UPI0037BBDF1E